MEKILVTGGCGYIGSHTIVELLNAGYNVVNIDNNSRSHISMVQRIEKATGRSFKNYTADICHLEDVAAVFEEEKDIAGIIHFAALKSVDESVAEPLLYYHNNIESLVNILQAAKDHEVKSFVFSSSCTVYGSPEKTVSLYTSPSPRD